MIVAGLGFRGAASLRDLRDALDLCALPPDALATAKAKAKGAAITELARQLGLPLIGVELAHAPSQSASPRVQALYATGSVAEAAALKAALEAALVRGAPFTARLLSARKITENGMATAALAVVERAQEEPLGPDPRAADRAKGAGE